MEASTSTEHGPGTANESDLVPRPEPAEGHAATRRVAEAPDKTEVEAGRRVVSPDVDKDDAEEATTWLLASFSDQIERPTHTLKLNVGSVSRPRMIPWTIRGLPVETIDKIREDAMPATNRAMRRGGLAALGDPKAQYRANLRLIVAATIDPDVKAVAQTTGLNAPEEFLAESFKYNSGLVDIIASTILTLSGYDEDNVQDAVEAAAVGN